VNLKTVKIPVKKSTQVKSIASGDLEERLKVRFTFTSLRKIRGEKCGNFRGNFLTEIYSFN